MQEKLEIGKICNVHGINGCVKLIPWTDFPEVIGKLKFIIVNGTEYKIKSVKYQKANTILKLEGVNCIEDAEKLKDCIAYCCREQLGELPGNTYYVADLIGCSVYEDENFLGKISYVIPSGGADLYEIKNGDGNEIYLPAIKENVLSVDIKNKIVKVKLPEGLL